MSKITWKPSVQLSPIPPALISCGTMEQSNILTVAWTGIVNTAPPMTYISVRPERYSYNIIKESGQFVINIPTTSLITAVDFCGVKSGANLDKFKEMSLTKEPVSQVSCPSIKESPVNLECVVKSIHKLGSHHMFLSEIVAVNIDESLIDKSGKLRLDLASLLAFAHGEYFALGKKLGSFGFSVKKDKNNNKSKSKF